MDSGEFWLLVHEMYQKYREKIGGYRYSGIVDDGKGPMLKYHIECQRQKPMCLDENCPICNKPDCETCAHWDGDVDGKCPRLECEYEKG